MSRNQPGTFKKKAIDGKSTNDDSGRNQPGALKKSAIDGKTYSEDKLNKRKPDGSKK